MEARLADTCAGWDPGLPVLLKPCCSTLVSSVGTPICPEQQPTPRTPSFVWPAVKGQKILGSPFWRRYSRGLLDWIVIHAVLYLALAALGRRAGRPLGALFCHSGVEDKWGGLGGSDRWAAVQEPARRTRDVCKPLRPLPGNEGLTCPTPLPLPARQITEFFSFPIFYYVCAGYSGLVVFHAVITTRDGYCVSLSNELVSCAEVLLAQAGPGPWEGMRAQAGMPMDCTCTASMATAHPQLPETEA